VKVERKSFFHRHIALCWKNILLWCSKPVAADESRRMADDDHGTYPVPGLPDRDGHVDAVSALRLKTRSNPLP
jgi:hypothetical protein